jgi:hypothetical protein
MDLPFSNMQIQHWNPGATMPLTLPIKNFCNTDDAHIHANIKANSAYCRDWVQTQAAHTRVAVICGAGPSLKDCVEDIAGWQANGADIFALNGTAAYLWGEEIDPDFQVILDARPESVDLIGPAREHLFCAQVHPSLFERQTARLWQINYADIEADFADVGSPPGPYAVIGGGGISVGNAAVCLAYALGYRTFHLYGYDSSANAERQTHAFRQTMNDGEPMCWTRFNGKDYLTSFTMKLQAEKFHETAFALEHLGCKIHVHGSGLLPDIYNAPPMPEVEKYRLLWGSDPSYRLQSPGEEAAAEFVERAEIKRYDHVLDLGCGTGRGGDKIRHLTGCNLTFVDFTSNCLDPDIQVDRFVEADLASWIPVKGTVGFCCDVLEHIPPHQVETVIRNCMAAVPTCYFQIATLPDAHGELIGQRLHLSVHPYAWWKAVFRDLGYAVLFSEERPIGAVFLVTIP